MHQHEGVVVHVDDPGVRSDLLGDLVGVVRGGQARADVEELCDPGVGGQVADRAGEEPALHPGDMGDAGEHGQDQVTGGSVGREIVLAAE